MRTVKLWMQLWKEWRALFVLQQCWRLQAPWGSPGQGTLQSYCKRASPQHVLVRQVPHLSNTGLIPKWVLIPCPESFIILGARLNSMGRPLKVYKPLTWARSGTLWLLHVPSLLLHCFIFKPLHSCHLHTLSTPAPQLLTPQALTHPCILQRGLSPWLPTFLSLDPLLPSPSYTASYLS